VYVSHDIAARPRNHFELEITMHPVCVFELHVTVSCIKILSAAQECFWGIFMSPTTTQFTRTGS